MTNITWEYNNIFMRGLNQLKNPWIWWAWFKGIVLGLLIGYFLF